MLPDDPYAGSGGTETVAENKSNPEPVQTVHGQDDTSLDGKARMLLLKDKRDYLGDEFVLAMSELGCVAAYPKAVWNAKMAKVTALSPTDPDRQYYEHIVLKNVALAVRCDEQGRVIIPQRLRERAKIESNAVVVGCTDHVQIWDVKELDLYQYFLKRQWELRRATASGVDLA
jgi:MraZ protein